MCNKIKETNLFWRKDLFKSQKPNNKMEFTYKQMNNIDNICAKTFLEWFEHNYYCSLITFDVICVSFLILCEV